MFFYIQTQGKESFDSHSDNYVYAVDNRRRRKSAWPTRLLDELIDHFAWIKGHKVKNHWRNGKAFDQHGLAASELFFLAIYYTRLNKTNKMSWMDLLKKLIIHYELENARLQGKDGMPLQIVHSVAR